MHAYNLSTFPMILQIIMVHPRNSLIILLFMLLTQLGSSQSIDDNSHESVLHNAMEYYENGAYTKSIQTLEHIMAEVKGDTLVTALIYLALNHVAIGDKTAAIDYFKQALSINPKLELDSTIFAHENIDVFEQAKEERAHESAGCSCFIPGIGQFMKGEEGKGRAIVVSSLVTLAGVGLSWAAFDSKHNYYLSLGPDDIELMQAAYDDYNRWRKITIAATTAFVAVYVYSIVDALQLRKSNNEKKSSLRIKTTERSLSLEYVVKL